ncbi:DegT/DnrJ/EryC1/StrS family aminotransferase [Planomonospora parontospora]|uniref:DegT/DnrJ/EryC1/StrS family aminotransferase n=1 Tax=Planomonospora parontospora TaxID=58119 RepID=UPI00166FD383|nr:DegT/DnrJ/EryC1/StrS family aminotransferase [Planomonospora parontospora]GGL41297.1 hypothetical protein GCM10014719_48190 [Planomonospora parontospora subsp. antibiotica]GII17948.1 hypothetical protein Ppa05_46740 [Planomonospora parontospora subsp. antibiotica]
MQLRMGEGGDEDVVRGADQAQGGLHHEQAAGTVGGVGCFSLKDGKLHAAGEGGYLLTGNPIIAARAAAYLTHWAVGAPGMPARSRLGRNYRLSAAVAATGCPAFRRRWPAAAPSPPP